VTELLPVCGICNATVRDAVSEVQAQPPTQRVQGVWRGWHLRAQRQRRKCKDCGGGGIRKMTASVTLVFPPIAASAEVLAADGVNRR
jgi:hypothetical protein